MLLRQCLAEANRVDPAPFVNALDRLIGDPETPKTRGELRALLELVQGYSLHGLSERAEKLLHHADAAIRAAARTLTGQLDVAYASASPVAGQPFVEPTTGMRFLWIPPGRFLMGSSKESGAPGYDPEAYDDETPAFLVDMRSGYFLSEHPVTNEQYRSFLAAVPTQAPDSWGDRRFSDPEQPVVGVSWAEARRFAAWLSTCLTAPSDWRFDLPTEAEWEYAARGTDDRRYPWGNEEPTSERAHFNQDRETGGPAPIGRHPLGQSPFGIQDMAGNVWEWCLDAWRDDYSSDQAVVDPCHLGDTRGGARVVRGGSWDYQARFLRAALRGWNLPRYRDQLLGFRLVCRGSHQQLDRLSSVAL